MKRLVLLALLLAACSSGGDKTVTPSTTRVDPTSTTSAATTTTTKPECGAGGAPTDGDPVERTITVQGTDYTYLIRTPKPFDAAKPAMLVFEFHGAICNPQQQYVYGNFTKQADADGAILVLPKSKGAAWEALRGSDPVMVDQLLASVEHDYCIDPTRVYATGMSSGAYMSATLACRRSDVFAAFGLVTANYYIPANCDGASAVNLVEFHGTGDPIVNFKLMDAFLKLWVHHDGCDPTPKETKVGTDVTHRQYTGCDPGGSVDFYVVDGGGHTWPGSIPLERFGKTTQSINASAVIWELFRAHTLGDAN